MYCFCCFFLVPQTQVRLVMLGWLVPLFVSMDDLGSFAKEFCKRMPVEADFGQGILVALKTSTNC